MSKHLFYKNDKEINRIVEITLESFEKDILKILDGLDTKMRIMDSKKVILKSLEKLLYYKKCSTGI